MDLVARNSHLNDASIIEFLVRRGITYTEEHAVLAAENGNSILLSYILKYTPSFRNIKKESFNLLDLAINGRGDIPTIKALTLCGFSLNSSHITIAEKRCEDKIVGYNDDGNILIRQSDISCTKLINFIIRNAN